MMQSLSENFDIIIIGLQASYLKLWCWTWQIYNWYKSWMTTIRHILQVSIIDIKLPSHHIFFLYPLSARSLQWACKNILAMVTFILKETVWFALSLCIFSMVYYFFVYWSSCWIFLMMLAKILLCENQAPQTSTASASGSTHPTTVWRKDEASCQDYGGEWVWNWCQNRRYCMCFYLFNLF